MRVRTKSQQRKGVITVKNGPYLTNYYTMGSVIGFNKTTVDNYPYTSKRILKDSFALNPFDVRMVKCWCSTSSVQTRNLPDGYGTPLVTGEFASFALQNTEVTQLMPIGNDWFGTGLALGAQPNYSSVALAKAYGKVSEPDVQLSNFLWELPQAISLLTNPVQGIVKFLRKIQKWRKYDALVYTHRGLFRVWKPWMRLNPKRFSQEILTDASNRWLELQFGLLPLISDIEGIRKGINDRAEECLGLRFGRGGVRMTERMHVIRGIQGMVGQQDVCFTAHWKHTRDFSSKIYYRNRVPESVGHRFAVDLDSLVDFLWEATPWSFVLDWVFGIGDWLHAMTNTNVSILGNYVSQIQDFSLRITANEMVHLGRYRFPCTGNCFYHQRKLSRAVNLSLPALPQLNAHIFSAKRAISALSLTWQKMSRRY